MFVGSQPLRWKSAKTRAQEAVGLVRDRVDRDQVRAGQGQVVRDQEDRVREDRDRVQEVVRDQEEDRDRAAVV